MGRERGGFTWYYTPCCLETGSLHSRIRDGICFLGGSRGEKAMIQTRKVVFVVIVVMTHGCVLRPCGKRAPHVELSFVFFVLRVCIVRRSALPHCPISKCDDLVKVSKCHWKTKQVESSLLMAVF